MRKFLPTVILGVLVATGVAAVPNDPSNYPFEKKIMLPSHSGEQVAELIFDAEMLQATDENFTNFTILTAKNNPVKFDAFFEKPHRAQNMTVVKTSSARMDPEQNLVDDNTLTRFQFNERTDGPGASWALIDLGEIAPLSRLEVVSPEHPGVKYLQIEAGRTPNSLKTIVSKRAFQWRTELETEPVRYVKISLWGIGVSVDELKITLGSRAITYWTAEQGESYTAFFGGTVANRREYRSRATAPRDLSQLHATLGKSVWNDGFPADVDTDSVSNETDNCPFDANRRQRDDDEDGIGDVCDNAPHVKNFSQLDTDHDGIGDLIDNCKLEPNSDQADRDEDGWGDACDNAHATEKWEPSKKQILSVAVIALLLLGGFGIWQVHKVSTRKK